ncbi:MULTISPECIES: glutathione S-transferase family protein [Gammaproteobacteria]|uniref:glutathione S-transferase family protein n=1 Tax=Gammaproteobacteria TaxID=1236 RepID=UPI000DCF69DB|nr:MULTISPECIES: glutathione S-transferase family protein [Gammaproteobacteria]RTE86749.1 glutathione S-transferase family protein [Aliidiomarina sp. B3213]TCZ90697.1 glutathione S-transferase family protein [Lysobacter sp. N42]
MKLFGSYTSPFVRHCRIALEESGEQFEFVETDYAQSAEGSPAKRVPYLEIGSLKLHDSSAILKYVREHSGGDFLSNLEDFDMYCLVNTAMDTCINLFLLERDGITPEQAPYLERQQQRTHAILKSLNDTPWDFDKLPWHDATIRLACFLDWALYRKRLTLDAYPQLQKFLAAANQHESFVRTAPPKN